jgi:hypothetical protein
MSVDREPVCGECSRYDSKTHICKVPLPSWAKHKITDKEVTAWRGVQCCVYFEKKDS